MVAFKKSYDPQMVFLLKLQEIYDVENQLIKALPKLAKASTDAELVGGFMHHLEETKNQMMRLEQIFAILDEAPKKMRVEGIRGIIKDGSRVTQLNTPEHIKDGMIAAAARHAEHYEMAGYLNAIVQAESLGLSEVVDLLRQNLEEEKEADATLAKALAKSL